MTIAIPGRPITKKNHGQIIIAGGHPKVLPSKQYTAYQERAGWYIKKPPVPLVGPLNVRCVYYMPTHHRVDLVNLIEATNDILVHYRVIADDNSEIVVSHDGSRVRFDKDNPRAEIYIEEVNA